MIRYKELAVFYIGLILQINIIQSQWTGGYADYGSYYVPYIPENIPSSRPSGPIQYVPVQASSNSGPIYSPASQYPPNAPYLPNGPYSSFQPSIFSNTPTITPQGFEQAQALSSAYPNQPIIIINNGGNGDTGGNSNNGNRDDGGGLFGNGNFNFGDLAALFLATSHHHGHKAPDFSPEISTPTAAAPTANPPASFYQGSQPGYSNEDRIKSGTVTHITIILPSTGGTVSVKEKKNKKDKNKVKKKNKIKDKEEDEVIISEKDDEDENQADCVSDDELE